MKVVIINGSPRKSGNTAKLLLKVKESIALAGAEAKLVHLYDYHYQGCKSCFACKLKNSKTNGLCAMRDDLRSLLEETLSTDGFVIGTPIYFGMPSGQVKSFFERLTFPNLLYELDENGVRKKFLNHTVPTAFICTMGCSTEYAEKFNYDTLLGITAYFLQDIFGDNENLFVYDTYQFTDYKKYAVNDYIFEHKKEVQATQFPKDLQNAFELGQRLVAKIIKSTR